MFVPIRRIAPYLRTVLVTGATGTGRGLTAKALHALSPAAARPFAVCNCSAVLETLFESELFGHAKGSCAIRIKLQATNDDKTFGY